MADIDNYGTGALGDATDPASFVNSYATVTSYTATTVKITTHTDGQYEKFDVGNDIMLHVCCTNGTYQQAAHLGNIDLFANDAQSSIQAWSKANNTTSHTTFLAPQYSICLPSSAFTRHRSDMESSFFILHR